MGTLVVTIQEKTPTSIEARDLNGQALETVKPGPGEAPLAIMDKLACRLGGLIHVAPTGKPVGAQVELKVLAPRSPTDAEDLRTFCMVPEMPQGMDTSQQRRVAVQIFEGSLTTAKWREWLMGLTGQLKAAGDAAAPAIRKQRGQELAAAASGAGMKDCWFASSLVSD